MKLIITRHGETEENVSGQIQGHSHGKLTLKGIEQAKKLAKRLSNEHIDIIYSSDLGRASNTTKEIAKHHSHTNIIYTETLRERDMGEYQGKSIKELKDKGLVWTDPKEGESYEQLFDRAKKFITYIKSKHPNKTILVVAHAGFNKSLIGAIKNMDHNCMNILPNTDHTSITIYEIKKDNHKLLLDNDTLHLR